MSALPHHFDDTTLRWLREHLTAGEPLHFATSGSTGAPKNVQLSAAAMTANAEATNEALGRGHWLLALPLTHIAGWMVCARAVAAGTAVRNMHGPFTAQRFVAAAEPFAGSTWLTALVPTQLARVLANPAARQVAASAHRIIVGGAALRPDMADQASRAGLRLVRTYGMTETSGGCVYDGVPLPGVHVRVGDVQLPSNTDVAGPHGSAPSPAHTSGEGVISVAGPMLADGYLRDGAIDETGFATDRGMRWFTTSDLGVIDDGVLSVLGRCDDVIISGGENVHPLTVERALESTPLIAASVVVGLPHVEWGQQICALIEPAENVTAERARQAAAHAASLLPRAARPKCVVVGEVPVRGIGKPDRAAAQALLREVVS